MIALLRRTAPSSFLPVCLVLGALSLALSPLHLCAQLAPAGPQIRLDMPRFPEFPEDFDREFTPLAAAPQPGGLVAVWAEVWTHVLHNEPNWMTIRARRFDDRLRPLGKEIVVREPPEEDVFRTLFTLDLASDAAGRFVVVWGDDVPPSETTDLLACLYDAEGQPRRQVFRVNARTDTNPTDARVAMEPAGKFLVTWTATSGYGTPVGRYGRAFDAFGEPLGDDFEIPLGGAAVAAHPDGGYVIAGRRPRAEGGFEVVAQRRDSAGRPVRSPVVAGEVTEASSSSVSLAVAPDGTFTVVWNHSARRFDAEGRPEGPILRFTDQLFSYDYPIGLAAAAAGTFIAWSSREPLVPASRFRSSDVFGRWIDATTGALGPVLRLNTLTEGEQIDPQMVALGDGAFAVLWIGSEAAPERSSARLRGSGGLLEPQGVFGRRLAHDAPGTLQFSVGRRVVDEAAGQIRLPVLRHGGTRGPVGAAYTVAALDAETTDLRTGSRSVHFEDGDLGPRNLVVPIFDDPSPERREAFSVTLHDPSGAALLGHPRRVVVELRDDDLPSPWLAGASEPWRVLPGAAGAVAAAADVEGGFVLAWESGGVVRARRFDAGGEPLGTEAEPTPVFGDELFAPALVAAGDGGFTLIWSENSYEFFTFAGSLAQPFDGGGAPVAEPFLLRSERHPSLLPSGFALARGEGGGLSQAAVADDGSGLGVFVALYDPEGEPVGESMRAHAEIFGNQRRPAIAAAADGSFVAVWESFTAAGPANGLYARRFDAAGHPRSGEILLAEPPHPSDHRAAADSGGSFAVVWRGDDGEGPGILARVFGAAGAPLGPEILVNTTTAGVQRSPAVALASGGVFLVVWESEEPAEDGTTVLRLRGQFLAASGQPLGREIAVAPSLPGDQQGPAVVTDGAGRFLVAWVQRGEEALAGVWARRMPTPALAPRRILEESRSRALTIGSDR